MDSSSNAAGPGLAIDWVEKRGSSIDDCCLDGGQE